MDSLGYKDVFRHAVRHGLVDADLAERWFAYRDARNATAHDCGEALAQETVAMLAGFVDEATALHRILREKLARGDA